MDFIQFSDVNDEIRLLIDYDEYVVETRIFHDSSSIVDLNQSLGFDENEKDDGEGLDFNVEVLVYDDLEYIEIMHVNEQIDFDFNNKIVHEKGTKLDVITKVYYDKAK